MNYLNGTQTLQNLARAFAGESQARNRYTYYAEIAKTEGLHNLYQLFTVIADNERAHGKVFFDLIVQGGVQGKVALSADYPFESAKTPDNIISAATGEQEEATQIYPSFAATAKAEGFPEVEQAFLKIAAIENDHYRQFSAYQQHMGAGQLFSSPSPIVWKCANCGHLHTGIDAPIHCPVCQHPMGYFDRIHD